MTNEELQERTDEVLPGMLSRLEAFMMMDRQARNTWLKMDAGQNGTLELSALLQTAAHWMAVMGGTDIEELLATSTKALRMRARYMREQMEAEHKAAHADG